MAGWGGGGECVGGGGGFDFQSGDSGCSLSLVDHLNKYLTIKFFTF